MTTQPPPASRQTLRQPLLALAMTFTATSCGPALHDRSETEVRMEAQVRRDALKLIAPDVVNVRAGDHPAVTFELRIAPGFYLPSRDEPDTSLLATWLEPPSRSFARIDHITYPHGTPVALPHRAQSLLAYDGTVPISVHFRLHRRVAAGRYLLPFVLHYQLCTVRGCEVPAQKLIRVTFAVRAADPHGDLNELAPQE